MKTGEIRALTGVRFVAAVWVVLFHIYIYNGATFAREHPGLMTVLGPLISQGDLGVDLFFLLSGFVLAHNYLDRMGPRPSRMATMHFVWLRLARIWPLYMVAIIGGGLLLALREQLFGSQPNVPLTFGKFVEQVFMVQQWHLPSVPNASWTGPAWSISAEWLAYLCFPVLALGIWRLQRYAGRAATLTVAAVVMIPLLVWMATTHSQAQPFMWLGRLISEFVCGMLLSAALSVGTPRLERACTILTPVLIVAIVGWLYLAHSLHVYGLGALVLMLFPLLIVGLAYGDGRLHRFLGSRAMVLGGGVSFGLYLVHVPLIKLFRDIHQHTDLVPLSYEHRTYGELGVALVSLVIAYLLYRHVEEPARRRMRAMAPARIRTESRQPSGLRSAALRR